MRSADRILKPRSYVAKLGTAFSCVALILAAGCSRDAPAATTPPPPEVRVVRVSSQTLANIIEVPGRLQAVRTAEVRARVNGIVQRRLFLEGSDVRCLRPGADTSTTNGYLVSWIIHRARTVRR